MRFISNDVEEKDDSAILLLSAFVITLLLFFLNSGLFNFEWGSWVVFTLYFVFIFIGEFFVSNIILKKYKSALFTFLSIVAGSAMGIFFVINVVLIN